MSYAPDTARLATAIGTVVVEGDDRYVTRIAILDAAAPPRPGTAAPVRAAANQLARWFAGEHDPFDLPLAPPASPRGLALRDGLVAVPRGTTLTYGALAARLVSSPRAIGQLCARNPFPIVVPCHRIVGRGGLGHYSAGGGQATKRWPLDFEREEHR